MIRDRRGVLVAAVLLIVAVGAIVLSAVVATVVLAVVGGYILLPLHRWLLRRGFPRYWSAILSSTAGTLAAFAAFLPVVFVLVVRRRAIRRALADIRGEVTLFTVGETPVVFDLDLVRRTVVPGFVEIATAVGRGLAILSAKLVVFAFVVFGVLYFNDRIRGSTFHLVPGRYHDVVEGVSTSIRDTVFGHYVMAFFGGALTFVLGLPVFIFLGFDFPLALALIGALIWLLPVVNVELFVLGLVVVRAGAGRPVDALVVGILGAVFLVVVPGLLVGAFRRHLGNPQGISAPAYFVGFVGGGLTVGPAGLVLGPLAVAVLLAVRDLLADTPGLVLGGDASHRGP